MIGYHPLHVSPPPWPCPELAISMPQCSHQDHHFSMQADYEEHGCIDYTDLIERIVT